MSTAESQFAQPYIFHAWACASAACLQAAANDPLVSGLSASFFHWSRICLPAFSYCARTISGTLPVQESYFARKSSHSGTPMLPLVEAVVVAGVLAAAGLSVVPDAVLVFVFVFVSVVEQPIRKMANARHKTTPVVLRMDCSFFKLAQGSK